MGKGGAILGLLGMLIGAGALGFTFIVWNSQNNIQSQITGLEPQDAWYRYYGAIYDVTTINTYLTIPNMSLTIDLETQASISLLFTGVAYLEGSVSGRSDLTFFYYLDETIISDPFARVGTFYGNNSYYYHSVALQYFIEGWSAGTHNISMFVRSTVDINAIGYCSLSVQSFSV
jgi:hypothetical protein